MKATAAQKEYAREHYYRHRVERLKYAKIRHLQNAYGLSVDEFKSMMRQQKGGCYLCGKKMKRLWVDHDHQTERVRKLLCPGCNTLVAQIEGGSDLVGKAQRYIREHSI